MPGFPDFDHWFPPVTPAPRRPAPPFDLRHPTDDDFAAHAELIGAWAEEQAGRGGSGRAWVRHFAGTSWLAESMADGRPLGVLLGFRSPERPAEGVVILVAVDPRFRRRGIGRDLVERFVSGVSALGATTVTAACRPVNRIGLAFFDALGFELEAGPGTMRLYGVPTFADWDGAGEDRAFLRRVIAGG